jgi:hypothetical protein
MPGFRKAPTQPTLAKRGTMNGFLNYVKIASPDVYQQLDEAGGYNAALAENNEFKNAWKTAAKEPSFETLQHDYIASKNYSSLSSKVQEETGLNVSERSAAMQDVVWPVAVQHGPGSYPSPPQSNSMGGEFRRVY